MKNKPLFTNILVFQFLLIFYLGLLYLLFYFENKYQNPQFNTIWDTLWFSLVTLSSVGYGDKVPISWEGKVIALIFIFLSVGFLGYLYSQIINFFSMFSTQNKAGQFGTRFTNHTVIIGWDDFGQSVADKLIEKLEKVLIVVDDSDQVELIYQSYTKDEVFVLFSEFDNWDQLRNLANLDKAQMLFINLKSDTEKLVYAIDLRQNFTDLKVILIIDNSNLASTFSSIGIEYALAKNDIAAKMLVDYVIEPEVAKYNKDLLNFHEENNGLDLVEFELLKKHRYIGKMYNQVFLELKNEFNVILVGVAKISGKKRELIKNPEKDILLGKGDFLLMFVDHTKFDVITKFFRD
jgi:voltage-gated potassium channel